MIIGCKFGLYVTTCSGISRLAGEYAQKSRFDETLGLDPRGLLLSAIPDHRMSVQSNLPFVFFFIDRSVKAVHWYLMT
jgi:hypothetical protein